MYTFTLNELMDAFDRAQLRGINVRIITDPDMVFTSGSRIPKLTKAGVPVHCPKTTKLMHHKFCILDGPQRSRSLHAAKSQQGKSPSGGILLTGSLNWTMQAFNGNHENILITSEKMVVEEFEREFERIWQSARLSSTKKVSLNES